MRRLLRVTLVVFVALACGGCAERATRPDADIFGSGLRDAARGVAAGRAFDDALLAARRDDDAAFESATARLARSGAPKVASLSGALAVSRWLGEAESLKLALSKDDVISADQAADEAHTELVKRIRLFENEAQGYTSLSLPMWDNRYGNYDDLARIKEWSAVGGNGGGEA